MPVGPVSQSKASGLCYAFAKAIFILYVSAVFKLKELKIKAVSRWPAATHAKNAMESIGKTAHVRHAGRNSINNYLIRPSGQFPAVRITAKFMIQKVKTRTAVLNGNK
jgi:hypothetical protein